MCKYSSENHEIAFSVFYGSVETRNRAWSGCVYEFVVLLWIALSMANWERCRRNLRKRCMININDQLLMCPKQDVRAQRTERSFVERTKNSKSTYLLVTQKKSAPKQTFAFASGERKTNWAQNNFLLLQQYCSTCLRLLRRQNRAQNMCFHCFAFGESDAATMTPQKLGRQKAVLGQVLWGLNCVGDWLTFYLFSPTDY